ncbi:hypothetical protein V2J09_009512 [Rumex salicifolius]
MSSREQVRAYHILIKHQGSRRKASWKDLEGRVISNTTKEAAISQLESIREDIVSGKAKFEDVARELSDCSSAKRGGDLGERLPFLFLFEFGIWLVHLGEVKCRSRLKKLHLLSKSVRSVALWKQTAESTSSRERSCPGKVILNWRVL